MDQKTVKQLLRYDPLTGVFRWNAGTHKHRRAGTLSSTGYIKIVCNRREYQAHRLAFLYMVGKLPTLDVDHKNCNRADNRWINLREVSRQVNARNRAGANKNNRSGWAGVHCLRKNKWVGQIAVPDGTKLHLGVFDYPEAAHLAYLLAKEVYFGDR